MTKSSILVTLAISISVMLLITVVFAVTVYSIPDKETISLPISMSCHDRILGYAQQGYYTDSKTVQAALASCSGSHSAM